MPQALRFADLVIPIRAQPLAPPYVPVCFSRLPDEALLGLPLYIRNSDSTGGGKFTLYAGGGLKFTAVHRERLKSLGVSLIHIRMQDQARLRQQLEDRIESIAADSAIEPALRAEFIYETTLEMIDETLGSRDLAAIPRGLRRAAAAIVCLYTQDPGAFAHFFAAARHDAATCTHAANAAVWIPALARALGESSRETLATLCLGAMLFDFGMGLLPSNLLAHNGKLTNVQKKYLLQHPELGAAALRKVRGADPVIPAMALQHHERLDGSGFPGKLQFEQIHPAARMLAILDTFDALTSFRPYRAQSLSPPEATALLQLESPDHYDPQMVEAWTQLFKDHFPDMMESVSGHKKSGGDDDQGRRRFKRFAARNPVSLRILELVSGIWTQRREVTALAHNLSRGGLGLLLRAELKLGEHFRARMQLPDGSVSFLTGTIVRCRLRPDGLFEAGARFVDLEQETPAAPKTPPVPTGEEPPSPALQVEGECVAPGESALVPVEGEFVAPSA